MSKTLKIKIPFSDLDAQHNGLLLKMQKAFLRIVTRSDFILGEEVRLFEKEFALFCGSRYAIGVSSGTEALFLSLLSLGVGPGDEVIVPVFTYIATALAVSYTGAQPVFVDIDEKTYNLDPLKIDSAITGKTKAIVPVHLYGQPADMRQILTIAKKHKLKVVEDAAQAHGARIKMADGSWRIAGSMGDVGCFSFYPSKNLGALGDAGIIVTDNPILYERLRILRDHGRISKYEHALIGYNARLDTLQAAMLRLKLKRLNKWNAMRREAGERYTQALKEIPGVVVPYKSKDVEHVFHVYAIRLPHRDEACAFLKDHGVGALIHYPVPLHLQKAYAYLGYGRGDFPVAEAVSEQILSLPMFPHLRKQQISYVVNTLKKIAKEC